MPTDHPAPSGESPLEERLRDRYHAAVDQDSDRAIAQDLEAITYEALEEIARLTAEVARLAAGWETEVRRAGELRTALDEAGVAVQRVNGRMVALPTRTTARLIAARAEAARYREALEEQQEAQRIVADEVMPKLRELIAGGYVSLAVAMIDDFTTKVWRGTETVDQLVARRALTTEGGDPNA